MKVRLLLGVILAALYGLIFRLIGGIEFVDGLYTVSSVTFLLFVPLVLGLIPFITAKELMLKSWERRFFYPVISVVLFFTIAFVSGIEDFFCIYIMSLPYIIFAGLSGLAAGKFLQKKLDQKHLYAIIILPFFLGPLESFLPSPSVQTVVESKITINEDRVIVWKNILEVPEISESEYKNGFFNYIGIPRPVKSKIQKYGNEEIRIGYFTQGLMFYETIESMDTLSSVFFNIDIGKSKLRGTPTDIHILRSSFFKFDGISYHLFPCDDNRTEVVLKCKYTIKTKMNFYGNFWAEMIIKDFENKLLQALKTKLESKGRHD